MIFFPFRGKNGNYSKNATHFLEENYDNQRKTAGVFFPLWKYSCLGKFPGLNCCAHCTFYLARNSHVI